MKRTVPIDHAAALALAIRPAMIRHNPNVTWPEIERLARLVAERCRLPNGALDRAALGPPMRAIRKHGTLPANWFSAAVDQG